MYRLATKCTAKIGKNRVA